MVEGDGDAPATSAADERAGQRMAALRPDLDVYLREVMRAQVASALFGASAQVKVSRYELRREVGTGGGGSVFIAWDPELTREVALKLIVATDPALRARALAEGQALAQLSHPNVVPVFDVGVLDDAARGSALTAHDPASPLDRVYLVMELVRGSSLRRYATGARRGDILAAYLQCAHGLAAAHTAGLVHRDFKPDNAVMGRDGRVRVIDFGLAIADRRDTDAPHAGTPRYMSPEQRRGEPLTPAADQYAFAAALRETLSPAPRWLDRILARALADDAAARFPSMTALADALRRDPATRWRRRILVAAPLVVAAAGYAVGVARDTGPAPCSGGPSELSTAWSEPRRRAVTAHLASLGTPYATSAAAQLAAAIDAYATQWIAGHRASCLAHQRGELSSDMYDRRQRCLLSARTQLTALVELGSSVGADKVGGVVRARPELPDPGRCGDAAALDDVAPPPPGKAAAVAQLGARLDRARVGVQAEAIAVDGELEGIVREAKTVGHLPTLARAQLLRGTALLNAGKFAEAKVALAEASASAFRAADYAAAVEAFARHAWILSRLNARVEVALAGVDQMLPLVEGLPANARFAEALLHNNIGGVWLANDRPDLARTEFSLSLDVGREVNGPGAVELANAGLNLGLVTEDPKRHAELFDNAIALFQARLGADHPATLRAAIIAANSTRDSMTAWRRIDAACTRMARLHPTVINDVSQCSFELGWLELAYGDRAAAKRAFVRVTSGGHRPLAEIYLAVLEGATARAAELLQPLRARARETAPDARWYEHQHAGNIALVAAELANAVGRPAERAEAFDDAIRELSLAAQRHTSATVARRLTWAQGQRIAEPAR